MMSTHKLILQGWTPIKQVLEVESGTNLRKLLIAKGFSPYTRFTRSANCGGRGICATCGVWIAGQEPRARHWHDRAAKSWGYPRLSCQITIDQDMTVVRVPDKWIWGGRRNRPDIRKY